MAPSRSNPFSGLENKFVFVGNQPSANTFQVSSHAFHFSNRCIHFPVSKMNCPPPTPFGCWSLYYFSGFFCINSHIYHLGQCYLLVLFFLLPAGPLRISSVLFLRLQDSLQLAPELRLSLGSWFSRLHHPSAGITGVCDHSYLGKYLRLESDAWPEEHSFLYFVLVAQSLHSWKFLSLSSGVDVKAQPGSGMSFGRSRELNRRIPFENSAQLGTRRDLMKNGYVDTYRFHKWTWSVVASPQQSSALQGACVLLWWL